MEVCEYSNTQGTSKNSCLKALEIEIEKSGQKVYLPNRYTAEEVVKLCTGINVSNITAKVESLKEYLEKKDDTCRRWLAQHLVLRWIPLEKNNQFLYYNLFKILNDNVLNSYIKQETFRNINILLKCKSKPEFANASDSRKVLQNYGHWLGLITVASNVPILLHELDLAGLLLYAYTSGEQELFHIAPFVAEVIMASTRSYLFKPNCSWLRPIYRLFVDLLRRLQSNLQEVALAQTQLQNYHRIPEINEQISDINAITKVIEAESSKAEIDAPILAAHSLPLPSTVIRSTPSSSTTFSSPHYYYHEINCFEDYNLHVDIPKSLSFFTIFPALERQTRQLLAKIVTDNLKDICQSSLTLSVPLSVELLKMHLSHFNDEQDLRITALTTVRSLTSAVALLHSRDFLTKALTDALQKLFTQYIQQYENPRQTFLSMAREAMDAIIRRNLEYAICYVIKSACNQSMQEIDKRIKEHLQTGGSESKENVLPRVQEMLDRLPPELSRNLTAEELCNVFPNHIFGFKQPPTFVNDVKKWTPSEASKALPEKARSALERAVLKKKLQLLFHDWVAVCHIIERPSTRDLLVLMQKHEITFFEETLYKFIKMSLKISTDASYKLLAQKGTPEIVSSTRGLCYFTIDAFTKLVCLVIKNGENISNVSSYKLLHQVLEIVSHALVTDHDVRQLEFNGLPFLRILMNMIEEFTRPIIDDMNRLNNKVKDAFKQVLLYVQPRRAPAFAFHWLEIIGHRKFIRLYLVSGKKLQPSSIVYEQLLVNLLKFMAPSLRTFTVSNGIKKLYEGTLRLMAVLLHDFPDFFCEYYFSFCDVIPSNCIQLRNIVLCAFPSTMKPPEPFAIKFNNLPAFPDMRVVPDFSTQIFSYIPADTRELVTIYTNKPQEALMSNLVNIFKNNGSNNCVYNVPLLNAFVSFVGFRATTYFKEIKEIISISLVTQHGSVNIFKNLARSFCPEGSYLLFNAIINQLRYPSALTHYFACVVLYLFKELNDNLKEQITHILFERLAAFRPHPWGLFITFIELIRNEQYKFWSSEFVHRYSDIRTLLINVAKKCNIKIPDEYLKR